MRTSLHTKFPANREINREFSKIGPSTPSFASDQHAHPIAYSRIPYATEQGISDTYQGIFFSEQGISICGSLVSSRHASSLRADHRPDVRYLGMSASWPPHSSQWQCVIIIITNLRGLVGLRLVARTSNGKAPTTLDSHDAKSKAQRRPDDRRPD